MKYFSRPFLICLLISVIVLYGFLVLGANQTVSSVTATSNENTVQQDRTNFMASSFGWLPIFVNNFEITLETFVPGLGLFYAVSTQYDSGVFVAGLAKANNVSGLAYVFAISTSPVGLVEYLSYIFAFAEGLYMFICFYEQSLKEWLRTHLPKTLLFCVAVLLVAALVEWRWFL